MSCAPMPASIVVRIARARSAAEIPVVTPWRASIETANAASAAAELLCILSRPSWSARERVMARQISPLPCAAMNETAVAWSFERE